jgi:hypothetical protein
MHKHNLNPVPSLRLNFNDLTAVRGIIRAYITYTRWTSKPSRERDEQLQVLESLYVRLASVPANVTDIAFLLSTAEVAALDCAIAGFCAFIRRKVPPSQERDETLQEVERMREALACMR